MTPEQAALKVSADLNTMLQRFVAECGRRLVMKTPVLTGEARAGWNPSSGNQDFSHDPKKLDPSGNDTVANIASFASHLPGDEIIFFITNTTPYIEELENGSSKQNPQGMAGTTAAEADAILADITRDLF